MFVIACRYSEQNNYILQLVEDIVKFHPDEEIVVVDSDSLDKSYFDILSKYENVIIEDIQNKNYCVGAYWHAFKKYKRPFYYMLHDSMIVKGNLDYLKEKDLTTIFHFNRYGIADFNDLGPRINEETEYDYVMEGCGVVGPIFFCKRHILESIDKKGFSKILPNNKIDAGHHEGCWGFIFESEGYDLKKCSLFGDILYEESPNGRSGVAPHNTSWQFPIEKFYASLRAKPGSERSLAVEMKDHKKRW